MLFCFFVVWFVGAVDNMCLHDRLLEVLWIGRVATGRRSANLLKEEREERKRKRNRKVRHNKTISSHDYTGNNKHSLLHYREPTLNIYSISTISIPSFILSAEPGERKQGRWSKEVKEKHTCCS